ncbi:hypothetical protein Tco_0087901, partial [Tanacetum coccineum]
METEVIDNQANLVNYDNENENEIDDIGYQLEEYIEVAHEDDENNHSNGYAKRGITRYGYIKNRKKTVKIGQTRTRERKRVYKSQGFDSKKGQKSTP